MKKFLLFTLFLFCQIGSVQAFDVQARVAYFIPQESRVRQIYAKHGLPEYQVEASMPLNLCLLCLCNWDAWTNFSYFQRNGHSTCLRNKTKIENLAITFGTKYYFPLSDCVHPYLGLGIGADYVRFNDHSCYVKKHTDKWGFAILAKSGVKFDLRYNVFLDFFADYSHYWFDFSHRHGVKVRSPNTGGLKIGLGVGYTF